MAHGRTLLRPYHAWSKKEKNVGLTVGINQLKREFDSKHRSVKAQNFVL